MVRPLDHRPPAVMNLAQLAEYRRHLQSIVASGSLADVVQQFQLRLPVLAYVACHTRHKSLLASIVLLAVMLSLCACQSEDRNVTVICSDSPSDAILTAAGVPGAHNEALAAVNREQLAPGTVLQLTPEAGTRTRGIVLRALDTQAQDFFPHERESWQKNPVRAKLTFDLDEDLRSQLSRSHPGWEGKVAKHIDLVSNATRYSLRDPLALINRDASVVARIRGATDGSRFMVVSAVSYGTWIGLMDWWKVGSVGVDLVGVGSFYLHLTYRCAPLERLNAMARASGRPIPVLFLFLGVKYNHATRSVEIDSAPLDLSTVDLDS